MNANDRTVVTLSRDTVEILADPYIYDRTKLVALVFGTPYPLEP